MAILQTLADLHRECMEILPAGHGEGQSGDTVPHVYLRLGHLSAEISQMGHIENPEWPKQHRYSLHQGSAYSVWTECNTYDDAINLLKFGWPEGVEKAREKALRLGKLVIKGQAIKYDHRPSVVPRGPVRGNVAAISAGLPDQYIARRIANDRRQGGKIIRMAINVSASGGVGAAMLTNRAAVIMALSDALRNYGRQLEITVFDTSGYATGKYLAEWLCKPAGAPFDATKIVFAAGHPATLRRIFFAMNEHVPGKYRGGAGAYSYGSPLALRVHFPKDYARFDIVIDSDANNGGAEWATDEGQVAWIKAMLKKQGIDVED